MTVGANRRVDQAWHKGNGCHQQRIHHLEKIGELPFATVDPRCLIHPTIEACSG